MSSVHVCYSAVAVLVLFDHLNMTYKIRVGDDRTQPTSMSVRVRSQFQQLFKYGSVHHINIQSYPVSSSSAQNSLFAHKSDVYRFIILWILSFQNYLFWGFVQMTSYYVMSLSAPNLVNLPWPWPFEWPFNSHTRMSMVFTCSHCSTISWNHSKHCHLYS